MTIIIRLLLTFILFIPVLHGSEFDHRNIPVQDGGRIKPLDTYARNQLLAFYGKRAIKHEDVSAIDWIFDLAIYPFEGETQRIFNIRNPEIVGSLGLKWDSDHLYNRSEVLIGLQHQLEYIQQIQTMSETDLSAFRLLFLVFCVEGSFVCVFSYVGVQ